jgi:hypothetical protein
VVPAIMVAAVATQTGHIGPACTNEEGIRE